MKHLKIILFLVFIGFLMSLSDCKQPTPQPKTELEKLPPATMVGKYTFGCLVNGKAWVTKTSLDASAIYQLGFLNLDAELENEAFDQTILFFIQDPNISTQKYLLNDKNKSYAHLIDTNSSCEYFTDGTNGNGELNITKFDRTNLIISGTFNFVVEAPDCSKTEITEGRFDLKFIP